MAEYNELFGKSFPDKTVSLDVRFILTKEERLKWHNENDFRIKNMCISSPLDKSVIPKQGSWRDDEGKFHPYNYVIRNCEMCGNGFPAHKEWETMCDTCFSNWLHMRNKVWELDHKDILQIMKKEEEKRKLERMKMKVDFQIQLKLQLQ